jgi:hypothetical protein
MMLPTKQFPFSALALLAAFSFGLVGCGKDKSLDDYQQTKTNEEFTKIQAVSGTFRGNLVTQNGTQPVEIITSAVLNPVPNGDNSGTNARATLQGSVTVYNNGEPSSGVITTANFIKAPDQDSDSNGTINGQISVVLSSTGSTSQAATFSLNGTLNNRQFNGVITPTDRSGISGSFTSAKDAPLPRGQSSTSPLPGQTRSYVGASIDPNCEAFHQSRGCKLPDRNGHVMIPVAMTVNASPTSSGYAFVNLFSDVKLVNVHLELDGTNIPLPPVEFDQRQKTLSYNGSVSSGSSQIIFWCKSAGAGFSCSYENVAQAAVYIFQLNPGSSGFPAPIPAPAPTPDPGFSPVPHHGGNHH